MELVSAVSCFSKKDLVANADTGDMTVWYSTQAINGVQNRMTEYPDSQPIPVGKDHSNWQLVRNKQLNIYHAAASR